MKVAEMLAHHGAHFGGLEDKNIPRSNYGAKSLVIITYIYKYILVLFIYMLIRRRKTPY